MDNVKFKLVPMNAFKNANHLVDAVCKAYAYSGFYNFFVTYKYYTHTLKTYEILIFESERLSMNALDYAINMELDGEKFYKEQARLNENNSIKAVCLILAEDEGKHSQILKKKMDDLAYDFQDSSSYLKIKNLFKDIGNFKSDIREAPTQLEFYRMALEKEKKSIDLYTGFLAKASDSNERELFEYLIKQEQLHFSLLDEIVTMLRHAEEWVESAEFGIRIETY